MTGPRALLAAALAPVILGSCDVGPRQPVPEAAPTPTPKYADVGAGICDRLDLPSLVLAIGEPGRVEDVADLPDADHLCLLDVASANALSGAQVTVRVARGEGSPGGAEIHGNIEFAATQELEPISGWWTDGNELVAIDTSDPRAEWMHVHTRVVDANLQVDIVITNVAVRGRVERAATTGFGKAVLRRLRHELESADL